MGSALENKPAKSCISLNFQKGIGLIEVLITLLIVSIGLLGMAAMQTNGLSMTSESLARSQAVVLANDIIERARSNYDNRLAYKVGSNDTIPDCNTAYKPSSSKKLVENDIDEWLNSLSCFLPGPEAIVSVDTANLMTVTVTWNSKNDDISNDGQISLRALL